MSELPAELWHHICRHLEWPDICRLRLVSKMFNGIASCYFLPEVTFYFHQDDFAMLRVVTRNPSVAKSVKAITYVPQLMKERMTQEKFIEEHKYYEKFGQNAPRSNDRIIVRHRHRYDLSEPEYIACYEHYIKALGQQEQPLAEDMDLQCFKEILPKMTGLKHVSIYVGKEFHGKEPKNLFNNCLCNPDSYRELEPQGCRHFEALIEGLQRLEHKIQGLSTAYVSLRFFNQSPNQIRILSDLLSNLSTIDLGIDPILPPRRNRDARMKKTLSNFLASLPRLKVLKISWRWSTANLNEVIKVGHCWSELEELHLCRIKTEEQELMSTLLHHQRTLRVLDMKDITLETTSWFNLIPNLRHKLYLREALVGGTVSGADEVWSVAVNVKLNLLGTECPLRSDNIGEMIPP